MWPGDRSFTFDRVVANVSLGYSVHFSQNWYYGTLCNVSIIISTAAHVQSVKVHEPRSLF